MGRFGQAVAVAGGRNDDLQLSAQVQDGAGEDLVGSISKDAHADQVIVGHGLGELVADGLVDQALGGIWQAPVSRNRYAHNLPRWLYALCRRSASSAVTWRPFRPSRLARNSRTACRTRSDS